MREAAGAVVVRVGRAFPDITLAERAGLSSPCEQSCVMAQQVRQGPAALVAADAAIGMATVMARACLRVADGLRPIVAPALRPENWPARLRTLAETGSQQRRRAITEAVQVFRKAAPAVVTVALDELDLVGIVREVVDKVDLPEIIRLSTRSVAGDTVRDGRIQVMVADDVVAHWAGRVFHPWSRQAGVTGSGVVAPREG